MESWICINDGNEDDDNGEDLSIHTACEKKSKCKVRENAIVAAGRRSTDYSL